MFKTLDGISTPTLRPHNRRLFGLVLRAFYQAWYQEGPEVATLLLEVLAHLVSTSNKSHKIDFRRSEHDLIVARELVARLAPRLQTCALLPQAGVRQDVLNAGTEAGGGVAHGQPGASGHNSKPAAPVL